MFKIGDAVRVKAGSPQWSACGGGAPCGVSIGCKLEVIRPIGSTDTNEIRVKSINGNEDIGERYLEPWNDAEEWDGSKWAAKKPKQPTRSLVMKFFEMVEHLRKHGGTAVYDGPLPPTERGRDLVSWVHGALRWKWYGVASDLWDLVHVERTVLDGNWKIDVPPPKEYSFAEAYAMMKQGKWMRIVSGRLNPRVDEGTFQNGKWLSRQGGMVWEYGHADFRSDQIDSGKWVEVTEPNG